ncbi:MAG: PqqD family protein [Deltaproteobacteria bacterium]|nr:MAG: PqqD family protein [Deltaproteobacteria bacterium]
MATTKKSTKKKAKTTKAKAKKAAKKTAKKAAKKTAKKAAKKTAKKAAKKTAKKAAKKTARKTAKKMASKTQVKKVAKKLAKTVAASKAKKKEAAKAKAKEKKASVPRAKTLSFAPNSRVQRQKDVAWRIIDGEAVIVSPADSLMHTLNDVGTRIWELLAGDKTLKEVAEILCAEFEVDPKRAEQDTIWFVKCLAKKGLVEPAA